MMTHYIIDGSNLLYYSGYVEECSGDIVMARYELNASLSRIIESNRSLKITVVYDVHSWVGHTETTRGGVGVVYAVGHRDSQPADSEIMSMIERGRKKDDEIVIVTNDSDLRQKAMFGGCRSMDCKKFCDKYRLR